MEELYVRVLCAYAMAIYILVAFINGQLRLFTSIYFPNISFQILCFRFLKKHQWKPMVLIYHI